MAFRALLFAVFGGFIGAAPAAPPFGAGVGSGGCVDPRAQTQKLERPETAICPAHCVAGAPPSAGVGPVAALPPSADDLVRLHCRILAAPLAPACVTPLPPRAAVRAGLLDLPPPAAL